MSELADLPVAGTVVLLRAVRVGFHVLLMRRPDRGSFPGAWVFPGGRVEPADHRDGADEHDDARRAAVRETREEVGLVVDEPVVLSRWHPPAQAPIRIRTWFFLADAFVGEMKLSADEVVDAVWLSPLEALARHGAGEWTLFPPTWMTLRHLSRFSTVEEALASAGVAQDFSTRVTESEEGVAFSWDGVRLETGSLPWRVVEV